MEELTIRTGNGRITIRVELFFPCSQARLRKLLKIIRQFDWLNDVQHITEQLNTHFHDRVGLLEVEKLMYGKLYMENMQKHAEYRDMAESRKHPNGIPLGKGELKEFRKKRDCSLRSAKENLADAKRTEKELEGVRRSLEMLRRFRDGQPL